MLDRILSAISGVEDFTRCNALRNEFSDLLDKEMRKFDWDRMYKDEKMKEEFSALARISEKIDDINLFPSILPDIPSTPPPGFEPPPSPPGFEPPGFTTPGFEPPPSVEPPSINRLDIKEGIIGMTISEVQKARRMLERDTHEKDDERNENDGK